MFVFFMERNLLCIMKNHYMLRPPGWCRAMSEGTMNEEEQRRKALEWNAQGAARLKLVNPERCCPASPSSTTTTHWLYQF